MSKQGDVVRRKHYDSLKGQSFRIVGIVHNDKDGRPIRCVSLTKRNGKLWLFTEGELERVEKEEDLNEKGAKP